MHDTRYIESRCARLTELQRMFGEAIAIRRTGASARDAMDPLVIVDDQHYLHRFHVDRPRAALGILQPQAAKPLIQRLREIWATGEAWRARRGAGALTGCIAGVERRPAALHNPIELHGDCAIINEVRQPNIVARAVGTPALTAADAANPSSSTLA